MIPLQQGEILALRDAALLAWAEDTRYPLAKGHPNKAVGQCYVTACWLQHKLGGKVAHRKGHYFWLSDSEEYGMDIAGDRVPYPVFAKAKIFGAYEVVEEEPNSRAQKFIKRADREYENLGSLESKLALDYAGDAYPGEEPEARSRMEQSYWHDEPYPDNDNGLYRFVYAKGEMEVSPFEDYETLASHIGVELDHPGPFAMGEADVQDGEVMWHIKANIDANAMRRVLKDFSDNAGWGWAGLTNFDGEPINAGSEFLGHVETRYQFRHVAGELFIAPDISEREFLQEIMQHGKVSSENFEFSIFGEISVNGSNKAKISRLSNGGQVLFTRSATKTTMENLIKGLTEWAEDRGLVLVSGNDNVVKRIEDLDMDNIYSPVHKQEERPFFPEEDKGEHVPERSPAGTYICQECERQLPSWYTYRKHMREEHKRHTQSEEPVEDGKFPEVDMDANPPTHFTETQPLVFPLASLRPLNRIAGIGPYLDKINEADQVYVAWSLGTPQGFIAVSSEGEIKGLHAPSNRRDTKWHLVKSAQKRQKFLWSERDITTEDLRFSGFVPVGNLWKWAAGKDPKDMIEGDVPFIFDVEEDQIFLGEPGSKTSQIPGKFTPGGIVEGTYEAGGKVFIRSLTNMPYSIRHLIELWYWSAPHLEVKSVTLRDDDGKETKLASSEEDGTPSWHEWYQPREHDYFPDWDYEVRDDQMGDERLKMAQQCMDELAARDDTPFEKGYVFPVDLSGKDAVGIYASGTYNEPVVLIDLDAHEGYEDQICKTVEHEVVHAVQESNWEGEGEWANEDEAEDDFYFSKQALSSEDAAHQILNLVAQDPVASKASQALTEAGGRPFVVGGAVRDIVSGKFPKDIDLMVTGLQPDEVGKVLEGLGGRVDITGKDFGVFRYREGKEEIEIALPRRERSTGETHQDFDVQADPFMSPEEDLERRDFTANAMAVDLETGELIDPFGGIEDLQKGNLRTVSPKSFEEDPLRLVRALGARSRHGLVPDEETLQQMSQHSPNLAHLPPERVQAELDKIFASEDPASGIQLAHDSGLLAQILPEVDRAFGFDQKNKHHERELGDHLLEVLRRTSELTDDPDLRLAALLHDVGKVDSQWIDDEGWAHYYEGPEGQGAYHELVGADQARERMNALRYPSDRINRVSDLVRHHMWKAYTTEKGARKFLNRVEPHADDLMILREADQGGKKYTNDPQDELPDLDQQKQLLENVRQQQAPTNKSMLAITGNDLIQAGLQPGPQFGAIFNELVERVLDDPSLNERDTLLQLAQGIANG